MATDRNATFDTVQAAANLSSLQYYLMTLTTTPQAVSLNLCLTRGGYVYGSLYDKSTGAGISSKVAMGGVAKVWCGGSTEGPIKPGTQIVSSTGGVGIPYSTNASYVVGYAVEHQSSGSTGIIAVHLTHQGVTT